MSFGGITFDKRLDGERLRAQLRLVRSICADGEWRTLDGIRAAVARQYGVHAPTPSVSARLRDLRKPKFGGHTVERRRVRQGLYEYRVLLRRED